MALISFNILFYYFDRIVTSTMMASADAEARAKATEVINGVILKEFSKDFNYSEIINVDKDKDGNIIMLKADTMKMNKIAAQIALNSQKELQTSGQIGVKIPLSYVLKSSILSFYGPKITVRMQPIGFIETKYLSDFESAGINQTRLRIYVNVTTNMRIFIPLKYKDIQVLNEVPIAETIIVGKVPQTAISLDLNGAGIKLSNNTLK